MARDSWNRESYSDKEWAKEQAELKAWKRGEARKLRVKEQRTSRKLGISVKEIYRRANARRVVKHARNLFFGYLRTPQGLKGGKRSWRRAFRLAWAHLVQGFIPSDKDLFDRKGNSKWIPFMTQREWKANRRKREG